MAVLDLRACLCRSRPLHCEQLATGQVVRVSRRQEPRHRALRDHWS